MILHIIKYKHIYIYWKFNGSYSESLYNLETYHNIWNKKIRYSMMLFNWVLQKRLLGVTSGFRAYTYFSLYIYKEKMEEQIEEEIIEEDTAEWDIAGTEGNNPLFPGDEFDLPSTYEIPPGENINDELG